MHRSSSNDPACRSEIGPRRASFHRSSSASAHSSICADDDSAVKCILRGEVRPDFARFATLAELFEHTVSQVGPSHVALQFGHEAMTYAELNAKADIAAHNLLLRGAGPNRVVGLFLNRGMGALVAQGTSPRVHKLTRFCCRAVAIAKAGAAWLPLDEEVPMDRACACLGDAGAIVCITEREVVCDGMACVSLAMLFAPCPPPLLRRDATRVAGEDTAYLIYTSGSTGKPKGIEICQHSIAHFLLSENSIIGIRKDDVVYQGFSLAFDMSFEEIWLSYASGAKIWIAPKEIITDVEALTAALERARVTVLHAVPTLLALFPKDLPTLRLINLGGEACPQALVEKWAVKPRRVFNTYGPSEATVSASIAELFQGQPVTIGRPLPNYGLCVCKVVDGPVASLLPAGQAGELCIFGPGLARGYLGRPDLSAKKFIECEDLGGERVYKTGDLALVDGQGQLSCLGRADDQVKIRGFRVELGEIEAALCDQPCIGTAAVLLLNVDGLDLLVAYCAAAASAPVTSATWPGIRQALTARLPAYMVPHRVEWLENMPRLTSGKIDRKALKARPLSPVAADAAAAASDVPETDAHRVLFAALQVLFPGQALHFKDDFFYDLGGHSLFASRAVSTIRKNNAAYAGLCIQDIYQSRTLEQIAQAMQQLANEQSGSAAMAERRPVLLRRKLMCGLAQLLCVPFFMLIQVGFWLLPFFAFQVWKAELGVGQAILTALASYLAVQLAAFVLVVVCARTLLCGVRPGRYALYGTVHLRCWVMQQLSLLAPWHAIHGTPLFNVMLRAMGARVGRDVFLGSVFFELPHLLDIGDGASVGSFTILSNIVVERGEFVVGTVRIGREANVGSSAVVAVGAAVGDFAQLKSQSSLAAGVRIPDREVWDGSPARCVATGRQTGARPGATWWRVHVAEPLLFVLLAVVGELVFYIPIFPSFLMVEYLESLVFGTQQWSNWVTSLVYFAMAFPAATVLIALMLLIAGLLKRMFPIKAGVYSVHESMYYRKWWASQVESHLLKMLYGIWETVYISRVLRLLGADIGHEVEVATVQGTNLDLLKIGHESFVASNVVLGDEEICGGYMHLLPTVLGNRVFLGNSSYNPAGTVLPDNFLLGVQSRAPCNDQVQTGQTWVGSPPLLLPKRDLTQSNFPDYLTFHPTPIRRLARGVIEGVRVVFPLAFMIGCAYNMLYYGGELLTQQDWIGFVLVLLAMSVAYGLLSCMTAFLFKWVFIGRFDKRAAPMWTLFLWLSEFQETLYFALAVTNFLQMLVGTPFLAPVLRLYGMDVGRDVYMGTFDFPEPDCVHIGDGAELNFMSSVQPHVYEDRVLKIEHAYVGKRSTIGVRTIVLLGSRVGDDCDVGPLSLVMKGEEVQASSRWHGCPLKPWVKICSVEVPPACVQDLV